MNNKLWIYIGIIVLLFAVIIFIDSNQPKPVDWRPTYSVNDKIPLGLYVLDQEAEELFQQKITKINVTPYEFFESVYDYDTLVNDYSVKGTFFTISQGNNIDEQSAKELFYFVSRYNAAFLSMRTFPQVLLDSLKIKMQADLQIGDSVANWLADPKLGKKKYYLAEDARRSYFSEIDSSSTTILGYQQGDSTRANFIKVRYYNGDFYLHAQPAAFTNFHLLKADHHEYAEKVLSHLPDADILWNSYDPNATHTSTSPLRYVFSQPALAWAWYLFVGGMLIFMFFNSKRKQRVVPVIQPLQNTTVEFAKTIGNLYYQEGDHDTIIDKKIIYFLEKIRNDYLIDTTKLDDDFVRKLYQKSGKEMHLIERAVFLINIHNRSPHNSVEEDLIQINNAIEKIIH